MKHRLDDIDKKEQFKVPEGYFEDLPLRIQKRIQQESPIKRRRINAWSLAMAASLVIIITYVFFIPNNTPTPEELLAEVSHEELLAYLDEVEIDEYELVSAFGDNEEIFEFEDTNVLDGIDIDDQAIDDVLLQYDLEDEYL
jgi:hypothetical protein